LIKYEASPVGDVAATNWAMIQILRFRECRYYHGSF
jgi:hypothetical protein